MTIQDICRHHDASMRARKMNGYDQHDAHVWTWLLYWLGLWGQAHPIRIIQ